MKAWLLVAALAAPLAIGAQATPHAAFAPDRLARIDDSCKATSTPTASVAPWRWWPPIPSGSQQLFRFAAQTSGVAIITFRHTGMNPTVIDTIIVR
jgi:hypothetical protein